MKRIRRRLSWVALSILIATAGSSVAGGPADPTLKTRLKATQLGGTLADYLNLVSSESRLTHKAEVPHDETPLVALNINQSPAALRSNLADNLELTWSAPTANKPAYNLRESPANQRTRSAARASAADKARRALMARLDEVRQMASLSKDELGKRARDGDARAAAMLHPRDLPMVRLAFRLPSPMWREFWDKGHSETRFASLPKELQDFGKLAAGDSYSGGENIPLTRDSDEIPNGRIALRNGGTFDRPTIWVCMKYGLNGTDFNLLYAEGWTREPPQVRRKNARQNPSRIPADPRFKQKVTLRDKPRKQYFEPGERPTNADPLGEYLDQLSEQIKMPILAQCDYRPKDRNWLNQQWWLASDLVDRPLREALDMVCADFEYEWRFEKGALLLRPIRWYLPIDQQGYRFPNWK